MVYKFDDSHGKSICLSVCLSHSLWQWSTSLDDSHGKSICLSVCLSLIVTMVYKSRWQHSKSVYLSLTPCHSSQQVSMAAMVSQSICLSLTHCHNGQQVPMADMDLVSQSAVCLSVCLTRSHSLLVKRITWAICSAVIKTKPFKTKTKTRRFNTKTKIWPLPTKLNQWLIPSYQTYIRWHKNA